MAVKTLISILLLLQFIACSSSKDTITIAQPLKEGDLLISNDKSFALGFFSPGNSKNKYVGIWFCNVTVPTVVWVANRNNPISGSSSGILSINQQGDLVLSSDGNVNPVWSANVSVESKETLAAQLLDTGNLVLVLGRRKLWQSFDYPTNTLIRGMKLGVHRLSGMNWFLTSWRSPDDPGIGGYSFKLKTSVSPQLVLYNGTEHLFWRSSPWPWNFFYTAFQSSFVKTEDEIYYNCSFRNASIIWRLVLDDSGSLRWQIWHQDHNQWKELWSAPDDSCNLYGRCGANSRCDANSVITFECKCLPGYEPKSPKDWNFRDGSGGCVRKRLNSSSICGHGEEFIRVESVKLPDSSAAVWAHMSTNRMECERKCKSNCSCSAYAMMHISENESGCLTWYGELIDIRSYIDDTGYDLYVRVDAQELAERVRQSSSVFRRKGVLSVVLLSAASAWFVLIIILVYFCHRMRKNRGAKVVKNKRNKRSSGSKYYKHTLAAGNVVEKAAGHNPELEYFDLNTIRSATDNFSPSNKIGQGGFGTVYKGQLADGQEIAVKRMSKNSRQGIEEFENEAVLIAKLQHKNLVKLLGCCIQRKEQMLIYEYMPNKSLDSFLFYQTRNSLLDWGKRFDIIVGIARGILYLHHDSRLTIIHRDLKSSNILLDAEMNPKISDFGMARIFHNDQIQGRTSRIVGTYGYMSPEYALFGKFSTKSDIFSFGVTLLEIVSGKKNNSFSQEDPSLSLIGQVWELWSKGRAMEIVDSVLVGSYDHHKAFRCIQVGLLCVQENGMDRPTMSEVVLMLKSETALPSPKQPAFIFRATSSNTNSPGMEEVSYSINEVTISEIQTR